MTLEDRIARTMDVLLAAARDRRMHVSGDGRLAEKDLEKLLGMGERYLRQLRQEGKAPPCYRLAGGRPTYRLEDAAAWLERSREQ